MMRPRLPLALWRPPAWPAHQRESGGPVILLYHSISSDRPDPFGIRVRPRHFAEHMAIIARHCRPMRLDRLHEALQANDVPPRSVIITFDDGFADNLLHARPVLDRHRIPATVFVASGYLDQTREFWWDELERIVYQPTGARIPCSASAGAIKLLYDPNAPKRSTYFELYERLQPLDHELRRRILDQLLEWNGLTAQGRKSHRSLTADEVVRLRSEGRFEIGAHTMTHPLLAAQPLDSQYEELRASKAWVENLLGEPVASFSYPYGGSGHYGPETVRAVADSGFARACSTSAHPVNRNDGPYELPRFNVTDMDGEQFERFLFS